MFGFKKRNTAPVRDLTVGRSTPDSDSPTYFGTETPAATPALGTEPGSLSVTIFDGFDDFDGTKFTYPNEKALGDAITSLGHYYGSVDGTVFLTIVRN